MIRRTATSISDRLFRAAICPALAQRLRVEIDAQLPADLGPWLHDLGELRRDILAAYEPGESRKLLLHQLAQRNLCDPLACPAQKLALKARSEVMKIAKETVA
jgi:precorrin-2 dehydrogenase/sirohydrochlorin ferrochelatase